MNARQLYTIAYQNERIYQKSGYAGFKSTAPHIEHAAATSYYDGQRDYDKWVVEDRKRWRDTAKTVFLFSDNPHRLFDVAKTAIRNHYRLHRPDTDIFTK